MVLEEIPEMRDQLTSDNWRRDKKYGEIKVMKERYRKLKTKVESQGFGKHRKRTGSLRTEIQSRRNKGGGVKRQFVHHQNIG